MKKYIYVIAAALLIAMPAAKAQQYNDGPVNDFHISYGYFTATQMAAVMGGVLATAFTGGLATMDDIKSTGAIMVGFEHRTNNWLWLGCELSGENDVLVTRSKDDETNTQSTNITNFALMATAKANWLRREHISLYSQLKAGVLYLPSNDGDSQFGFAPQITPLGLEAGSKNLLGFAEIGVGMQGLIIGGIRFRF